MFSKYEFKSVTQPLSMNQKYQSSITDLHKYKEQMLRCSRNETISKFENLFENLIFHVFTTILLSHYYFWSWFSGYIIFKYNIIRICVIPYLRQIYFLQFKTIVRLCLVILRKFDLRRIVDANNINIIEKLCFISSYVCEVWQVAYKVGAFIIKRSQKHLLTTMKVILALFWKKLYLVKQVFIFFGIMFVYSWSWNYMNLKLMQPRVPC